MKIKIDTVEKTIQVEQECMFTELLTLVKKLFPDNEWKQYKVKAVGYIYEWGKTTYIPSAWWNDETVPFTLTTTGGSETYFIETVNQ